MKHRAASLLGRLLDRLTAELLRRRLRANGVHSTFFEQANAEIEDYARRQVANGRAENERLVVNLARQAALAQFENCRGTTVVQ